LTDGFLLNGGTAVDVFRLSVTTWAKGWTVELANALVAIEPGDRAPVPIGFVRSPGAASSATVTITAVSESDPSKTSTATTTLTAR
jgi:hypothetical protein